MSIISLIWVNIGGIQPVDPRFFLPDVESCAPIAAPLRVGIAGDG